MIRQNQLAHHLSNKFAVLAAALAVAACSDSSSSGGYGTGGPSNQGSGQTPAGNSTNGSPTPGSGSNANANQASGSSGGRSGSSGGTGIGSTGGGTRTGTGSSSGAGMGGSPSSSSGGSSGGSSSGSMGTASGGGADAGSSSQVGPLGSIPGCGQGTSCTPGNDLPVPAATDGFQVATPDGSITVQPGEEQFLCYYKNMPNTDTVNVGTFQSWMTPGSSHHFIAYSQGTGGPFGGVSQPDGTLNSCGFGGGSWVYATSLPGTIVEMKFPTGVGLPFATGSQIMLNMHFINPGSTAVSPVVKMNMLYVSNLQYTAAAMTSFNSSINVPAATAAGPGTQTVTGTCTAPTGANFFVVTTHTHKHATLAEVDFVSGGQSTNLVHTTDWEHPDVRIWQEPNFLTIGPNDSFTYSCSYSNDSSNAVTVGETAASNEMCMEIAYYFPAGSAICQ